MAALQDRDPIDLNAERLAKRTDPGSFVGTAARVLSFTCGPDHVYGLAIESRRGPAAR